MEFLFEMFPVLLFFIAFKFWGIYVATAVAIGATFVQVGYLMARGRKVKPMLWVSLAIIVIFGGSTLYFQDETFIKWKPTILYWAFALVLGAAHMISRKNLLRSMLGEQVQMPEPAWARLLWSWIGFFLVMGALNLIVAFNYSTETWVNFKLFGGLGLMLLFVLGQGIFLAKYMKAE